jgi:4'-phosphopantetheinyl transferase
LKLADQLNLDRPIYGLELQGLDGKKMPHKSIEEMASYFIDLIQGIQKNGPYNLAGYSLGGRIAFEIACQLTKKDQDIGMLALVSATAPGYMRTSKHSLVRYVLRLPDFINLPFTQKIRYFRFKINDIKKRIRRWKEENTLQSKQSRSEHTFYRHIKKVEQNALEAWINYKPQVKYAGNVLLVRETRIDSPLYRNIIKLQSGWERFITGRIETQEIASGHVEILKDPYVGQLAKCISNYFHKIDKSTPDSEIHTKEQEHQQRKSKISIVEWTKTPEKLRLPQKQCHIFCALLKNHHKFLNDYENILSKEEKDRASRIVNASDREQFIIRRMLLRQILSRYTHIRPGDILLDYSATGKPTLLKEHNPSDLRFSISRRNDLALFAFACQQDIGIDLEYIQNDKDLLGIAREQFSTQEHRELSDLPANERNIRFYSYWTCKEAYIKARGIISLDQFEISIRPDQPPILSSDHVDPEQVPQWTFDLFKVDSQNLGALAIRGQCPPLTYWRI